IREIRVQNSLLGLFRNKSIIFDKHNRVLLCHRRDLDVWNLPGGRVESGELPTEAAVRETREETGLDIEIERLVGVYAKPYEDDIVLVFTGKIVGGKLTPTDEADECRYFAFRDFPANTIPKHVERIQDAAANHPQPVFRRQTSPSTCEYLKQLRNLYSSIIKLNPHDPTRS
ncbi:MAG: NUDIX domain-containing protein, partial [Chloroflexi bacterium]|nr:NUDIX domain-containing protein [Chloroflexota bacterium]